MTWMPDNGRSFSASEGPINVAAGLRQWSVHLPGPPSEILDLFPRVLLSAVR
jgi:hypothetical protein